jgi:hypothetical protein
VTPTALKVFTTDHADNADGAKKKSGSQEAPKRNWNQAIFLDSWFPDFLLGKQNAPGAGLRSVSKFI